jgi:hypothetical protein
MSRTIRQDRDIEEGKNPGVCYRPILPKFTIVNKIDGDRTLPAPNQASQPSRGESSSFGDSSGPLFSIYSKAAEEEDNKMAERWQKDADGILFFVSPRVAIHAARA